jgi:hypothetical protein
MQKLLIAGSLGFVLTACADPAATCQGYGFTPGTTEYSQCQMEIDARNRTKANNLSDAFGRMGVMGD